MNDSYDEEDDGQRKADHTVMDYSQMTDRLFFRIFQCQHDEEILVFDQLDMNTKIDQKTRKPVMSIGQAIVAVETQV